MLVRQDVVGRLNSRASHNCEKRASTSADRAWQPRLAIVYRMPMLQARSHGGKPLGRAAPRDLNRLADPYKWLVASGRDPFAVSGRGKCWLEHPGFCVPNRAEPLPVTVELDDHSFHKRTAVS